MLWDLHPCQRMSCHLLLLAILQVQVLDQVSCIHISTVPNLNTYDNCTGPLRHPRPMTVADLHLVLEKEQEAVVCAFCYVCLGIC